MKTITLIRTAVKGKAVTGSMTIPLKDGEVTVPTLENRDFLIPDGNYPLERNWSPKFRKLLPQIKDVPDRSGIRIHRGTVPEHSQGCVLLSVTGMSYITIFFNQIEQRYADEEPHEDEPVFIDIRTEER